MVLLAFTKTKRKFSERKRFCWHELEANSMAEKEVYHTHIASVIKLTSQTVFCEFCGLIIECDSQSSQDYARSKLCRTIIGDERRGMRHALDDFLQSPFQCQRSKCLDNSLAIAK
eukprot:scaffold242237_cov39-Prasinocladus_malaysianus.AAC.1